MTDEQPKPQAELLDRLSDAVERLLRQGATFEEIKINDLVREGGLAKSTFYVYFADKTALLSALAQRVMSDLVGFDAAWWHLPPSASKHEIALALSAMFEDYRAHGLLLDAITAATVYDQALRTQFGALMGVAVEATAEFLRTSQAAGLTPRSSTRPTSRFRWCGCSSEDSTGCWFVRRPRSCGLVWLPSPRSFGGPSEGTSDVAPRQPFPA